MEFIWVTGDKNVISRKTLLIDHQKPEATGYSVMVLTAYMLPEEDQRI